MPYQIPLGPQVKIGVRIGYAKAPNAKMVLMSLTSGTVTVVCNGVSYPVILAATDSDTANSPAGYIGTLTMNGLAEFTEYSYTATKGADSVTGSFRTLPGREDDFCFYAITCDAPVHESVNAGHTDGEGFYKTIKQQVEAGGLPCVGIFHIDDHGYTSTRKFTDAAAGVVGLSASHPSELNTKYAYSAAWLSYYGMYPSGSTEMGTAVSGFGNSEAYTTTGNIDIGRVPSRVWCMQNLPVWPQWGDWEFQNDIGFDFPTTNPGVPNGYHKTYTAGVGNKDGGGYLAWQTFMAPLQPPSVAVNDTDCNLWAFDLGCTRIIAADCITKSQGNIGTDYGGAGLNKRVDDAVAVSSILGTGQIADIKAAADSSASFTFLGLANGIQYISEWATEFLSGAQHPIKNHCPSEFNSLFSDADSLSAIPATSGQYGQLFAMVGDLHHGHIYRHQIDDGVVPTDFYEIGLGTATKSFNHTALLTKTTAFPILEYEIGDIHRGSLIEYIDKTVGELVDLPAHTWWGVRVSVYGSRAISELVVELIGESGVLWNAKFLSRKGSTKFSPAMKVPQVVGTVHA